MSDDEKFDLIFCSYCDNTLGSPQHKFGCGMSGDQVAMPSCTTDGHHTFKELYEYRLLFNAALFNAWQTDWLYDVHKSKRHSDGELCFGGLYFIVVAELPTGQISNHYKLDYWDFFKIPERDLPNMYDGHTPRIAAYRLYDFIMIRGS